MRKIQFLKGEYYHVLNRGTDGRIIFSDVKDIQRFLKGMKEFNNIRAIGSIYQNQYRKNKLRDLVSKDSESKLVNFICYCLNPNHYHFILEQLTDRGIEKFMHKLGVGYTMFFNQKYKRSGRLFQGTFKAVHINSNNYLLHLSAYVNLNNKVHQLRDLVSKSSWDEYKGLANDNFCDKDIILDQFNNREEYINFAKDSLEEIKRRKDIELLET